MQQLKTFTIEPKKQNIDSLTQEQEEQLKSQLQETDIIVLKGNSYSKQFFAQFAGYVKQAENLKKINANDIFVGRGKDEIPESLTLLSQSMLNIQIISIDLSNNAVNPFGAEALKPFLKQATQLQRLFLNNCGLGIRGTTHIAEGLAVGGASLEILAIARNRAECDGAVEISKALINCKKLKELHIYQNGIKQLGMPQLLNSLAQNCPELNTLDVRDNFIHLETTESLVNLIVKCKQLNALNIADCNIQTPQNVQILEALKSVSGLERLGYNYAELNDNQGQLLVDIISKHVETITKLELKGNELKKQTKEKLRTLFENKKNVLGAFESDDEDEEENDELSRLFSQLQI